MRYDHFVAGYPHDPMINEGCITFSPDGKIMVFGKGNSGKTQRGQRRGSLPFPVPQRRLVRAPVNQYQSAGTWDSTPAFSPDGRTRIFLLTGKGLWGDDIYSAQMDSRGRFGKIRNLGPDINTSRR